MRAFRLTSVLIALAAAALVTGCGPEYDGYPDRPDHPGYPGPRDGYGNGSGDVQGTVVRVGRRDHVIVLDSSDTGDRYDRRGGYRRNGGGEVALFYDDNTTVEYQGRTFRPEDLERGDRIQATVARTGDDRLVAENIQVLYDVSSGGARDNSGYPGDQRDPGYQGDRQGDRRDPGYQGDRSMTDLRGTVRRVDSRDRSLEIEPSGDDPRNSSNGQSDVVVVHYDAQTAVEYQGRSYRPENLEQGDVVEVHVRRDRGGRLLADQITVVSSVGQRGR